MSHPFDSSTHGNKEAEEFDQVENALAIVRNEINTYMRKAVADRYTLDKLYHLSSVYKAHSRKMQDAIDKIIEVVHKDKALKLIDEALESEGNE